MDNFEIGFKVRDKKGIEMAEGDLLKCFHFVAAVRREKIYTYKVVAFREGRMYGAHLSSVLSNLIIKPNFPLCTNLNDKGMRIEMEIVESRSWEDFDKRKKQRISPE